jgi:hypothetical protein
LIRYVRQRDRYSCGPIAIINAIKWAGKSASIWQDFEAVTQDCKCVPPGGTKHADFDHALRKHSRGFRAKRRIQPSFTSIERYLRMPRSAVIVNYAYDRDGVRGAHYALFIGTSRSGESFVGINIRRKTVFSISRQEFMRDLRRRKDGCGRVYPRVWFLTKTRQ